MPSVIGLDIGNTSYRLVEISFKNKKPTLEKALACDTCANADLNKSAEHLKEFVKSADFSTKDVVIALPESKVFSTIVSLPFKTEKELKGHLEVQGGKIFPKPLSELVYSFQILGQNEKNKNETDVNVVACGKTYVEGLYTEARQAGLKVMGVEPESYSIVRALLKSEKAQPNEAALIVNMSSKDSDVMVVRDGFMRFSRNISIGGNSFSKALSQALSLTEEQALEYKKSYGLEKDFLDGKVRKVLLPVADTLINEIQRTMNYFLSRNNYCEFRKVIYSGGSSVMPGLMAFSAQHLGVEVELANPFAKLEFSQKLVSQKESLINSGPMYTVAVGLALKAGV